MYKTFKSLLLVMMCFALILLSSSVFAEGKDGKKLSKTTGVPNHTRMNINNISTWIYSNGDSDLDNLSNAGFTYPKGSGKTAVFESGFVWGAKVNGEIRTGGSTYNSGLQTGKILSPGKAENPDDAKNRIYRVRPDYKTANLTAEVKDESVVEGLTEDGIRKQYETDWNEWPWQDGAPYDDVDGNGEYNPNIDIPGVPGASQTVWYVANDLNSGLTTKLYGAQPMGIEMQATMWAYSQAGPLSNMFFRKYMIINKSNTPFTDMYVTMWSDPDNGDGTDDYAGCDTTLSLGYCYNSNPVDAVYKETPPPATGFDFFQGPIVAGAPTDSAIFHGQKVMGKKNLPMTAFFYFTRGDPTVTDPTLGSYEGSIQMYNFMQGKVGKSGQYFLTPEGKPTTYVLTGDPVTGKGWVDGQIMSAGDRRIGLSSGPFTMAIGDTQEVVVAEMAALGSDRLQSVSLLKNYDKKAQDAYNSFFKIPTGATPPQVTTTPLNNAVVLSWGDPASSALTENYNSKGFKFQGYNVYQLPSPSANLENAKLIATYDLQDTVGTIYGYVFNPNTGKPELAPTYFGTNSGLQRSITITKDYLNGGIPLNNGSRYYFAVTSYSFNPDPSEVPNVLENPISAITVVPQAYDPGVASNYKPGDVISNVTHSSGFGDAKIDMVVIDPTKTTGDTYSIKFSSIPYRFDATYVPPDSPLTKGPVEMTGNLIVNETGDKVKYDVELVNPDSLQGPATSVALVKDFYGDNPTVLKTLTFTQDAVISKKKTALYTGEWTKQDAQQPLTDPIMEDLKAGSVSVVVYTAQNPAGEVDAALGLTSYPYDIYKGDKKVLSYQHNLSGSEDYPIIDGIQLKVSNVSFQMPTTYLKAEQTVKADPKRSIVFGHGGSYFDYPTDEAKYFYNGGGEATTAVDLIQDLELRFTGVPAVANNIDTTVVSGGSIGTIRSRSSATATKRVRLPFELWEVERNRQINVAVVDRNVDANAWWGDTGTPNYFRVEGREYIIPVATPYTSDESQAATATINRTSPNTTWIFYLDPTTKWTTGDKFVINYANPVVPSQDLFNITAPAPVAYNAETAKEDVQKVNVFPNPYYGVNPEEINKYQRFVTFSHLPKDATIRIFNLAGQLIKTITRQGAGSQFERWDLANESGLPVGSGMYIAHIDMGSLGTKILKLAIIQEQQVLDRF